MKKNIALVFGLSLAFTVFAECVSKLINGPTSEDASSNSTCFNVGVNYHTNYTSGNACDYKLFLPTYKVCTNDGTNNEVCSSTNGIDIIKTTYSGSCNGRGGCGTGTLNTLFPTTTNHVAQYFLTPCGG